MEQRQNGIVNPENKFAVYDFGIPEYVKGQETLDDINIANVACRAAVEIECYSKGDTVGFGNTALLARALDNSYPREVIRRSCESEQDSKSAILATRNLNNSSEVLFSVRNTVPCFPRPLRQSFEYANFRDYVQVFVQMLENPQNIDKEYLNFAKEFCFNLSKSALTGRAKENL